MKRVLFASLTFLALSSLAAPALAQEAPAAPEPLGTRQKMWTVSFAHRRTLIRDPALDAFSKGDSFSQWGFGMSRAIFARGRFSLAPGLAWDYGQDTASARGAASSFTMHRLAIPVEARWHFAPWIYGFARATPGATWQSAQIQDASGPAALVRRQWSPSLDMSLGGALLVAPVDSAASVRFWVTAEGGWSTTTRMSLDLRPDLPEEDPRRTGLADLGSLSTAGPFARLGVALSF